MNDHKSALVGIFEKAGEAHAFAYAEAGENNDWAIWYAGFLRGPLSKALGRDFTVAELTVCLMIAEDERLAMHGPDHPWPDSYADHFLARFTPPNSEEVTKLSLYYYPECPFCQRVLHAIRETGAEVELRHVWNHPQHRLDLQAARGRTTVPVLRITGADGSDRWMPESLDIARYLKERARGHEAERS